MVNKLLIGRALGLDEDSPRDAEGSTHCGAVLSDTSFQCRMEIWNRACGLVVPIFKKGDRGVCSMSRGSRFSVSLVKFTTGFLTDCPTLEPGEADWLLPGCGTVNQMFTLTELLMGHGSLTFQPTCVLLTWRKLMTVPPRDSVGDALGVWGTRVTSAGLFSPCITKVRAVSVLLAQSRAC